MDSTPFYEKSSWRIPVAGTRGFVQPSNSGVDIARSDPFKGVRARYPSYSHTNVRLKLRAYCFGHRFSHRRAYYTMLPYQLRVYSVCDLDIIGVRDYAAPEIV